MAEIFTAGGATSGYWPTGSVRIASTPASIIRMAITQAKTGRRTKKRENIRRCLRYC
ncbi:hypothetical protein [Klebsiella pneumoniae IS43]|uniref:Uncharacterized protein n=1 Tax=Klebsiella pneumoniae IS43 TaxID=1432552 RepID=W1DRW5_KLEPN|nr:hypothetical protein [Klebsiella pneumoniae IS43]CDL43884.1 hypothetical protein [Klebsiella pneumoniae ISC21]